MEDWTNIIALILAAGLIFLFWPGAKRKLKESREATSEDWKGLIIPLGLVIAFVFLLISMV